MVNVSFPSKYIINVNAQKFVLVVKGIVLPSITINKCPFSRTGFLALGPTPKLQRGFFLLDELPTIYKMCAQ